MADEHDKRRDDNGTMMDQDEMQKTQTGRAGYKMKKSAKRKTNLKIVA